VDIILGGNPSTLEEQEEVKKLGGLCVLGTERHESRRIDNQLRGRAGRQGDPGSSQFFVSMEDDLMRIFGGDRMKNLMNSLGLPEGMPIKNKMISSSIEKAQQKVEGHNFDIRKHLVEYDDVINKHREVIYKKRNQILTDNKQQTTDNGQHVLSYVKEEIETVVKFHTQAEPWNLKEIEEVINTIFPLAEEEKKEMEEIKIESKLVEYLFGLAEKHYEILGSKINSDENIKKQTNSEKPMRLIERSVLLRAIDTLWVEHIDQMDHMRHGIGLVGYGQKDPLVEYKREAYRMFNDLLTNIRKQVVYSIFKISITNQNTNSTIPAPVKNNMSLSAGALKGGQGAQVEKLNKVGRNDPCPCGSGKKYKKCHGA
jgi:preprotein translocase subunit SecA